MNRYANNQGHHQRVISAIMYHSRVQSLLFALAWVSFPTGSNVFAQPADLRSHVGQISKSISQGINDGVIVGAQLAVGSDKTPPMIHSFSVISPDSRQEVDAKTQFCIGSCSKPFAAICILTLVDDGTVDLDQPVDRWVPEVSSLLDRNGRLVAQSPTLRQLLAHRGGIYSQKDGPMTPEQTEAIRNFRLSLDESVGIIGRQPLIASPGETYAYSGAGYCLAGLAAQRAAGMSFDELLQLRVCLPLGLMRTTYFPKPDEKNIAVSGVQQGRQRFISNEGAPHFLGEELRLPLVGGSLYSTAEETAAFAQMMLKHGRTEKGVILGPKTFSEATRQQFDGQGYGLGWGLLIKGGKTVRLQHTGSLLGYRSVIVIDAAANRYVVIHWTLADPRLPKAAALIKQLESLAMGNP